MGYFSCGTEGMDYEELCVKCQHGQDPEYGPTFCPVLMAHSQANSEQVKRRGETDEMTRLRRVIADALGCLIPRHDGRNCKCKMFIPVKKETVYA